jgi:hypothetical protein
MRGTPWPQSTSTCRSFVTISSVCVACFPFLILSFLTIGADRLSGADQELKEAAILARLKVLAGMNVSERRLPQDGRISATLAGRKIVFRVSSVPTSYGESIVCRVLDPKALRLGWSALGFDRETTQGI